MKFQKLSRALLLLTGGVGMTLGLTSCSNDHTVGYIYVLGTTVSGQTSGTIGAYKEDNNDGYLSNVSGGAVSSGGSNPVRAVVPSGNRFMYVLNAGSATTDTDTTSNTYQAVNGYSSAGITLFSIGGYGQLTSQLSYASQGYGQQRIAVNSAGTYLYVLDEYAPVGVSSGSTSSPISVFSNSGAPANYPCQDKTNPNIWHPTGDISVYAIDAATGRLQVQVNRTNTALTYFPVGCYPTDFRLTASYLYTMDAGVASNNDVQTVNVQAVSSSTGQLTPTQTNIIQVTSNNSSNISAITGDNGSKYIYLLDTTNNKIYVYSVGANGALVTVTGSPFTDNTSAVGPIQSVVDSTGKYAFFANGGIAAGNTSPTTPSADVTGYNINATTGDLNVPVQTGGFTLGTVSSPVCIFEDPSNQFIYVAGSSDSSITGRKLDPNTGTLRDLNRASTFPTVGTPSWCLGISSAL